MKPLAGIPVTQGVVKEIGVISKNEKWGGWIMFALRRRKGEVIYISIKRVLTAAACSLPIWLLTACATSIDDPVVVEKVLLVYLGGDNNLSAEITEKQEAIEQGYSDAAWRRILIYRDSRSATPCLMEIDENGEMITLESYNSENSADPKVFSRVVGKVRDMYPHAVFNLLVFSHATGWLPEGLYTRPRAATDAKAIIFDNDNEMDLSDFAEAIPNHCFNYIIFEACHMAGIEVAYQLKDKADYIAASSAEIVSPGFTDTYRRHIDQLVKGDPIAFMRQAFEYFNIRKGYLNSATFSIIQTEALETLAGYVKQHCNTKEETDVDYIQHFDRDLSFLFCDFADYYCRLVESENEKKKLQSLIDQCVIWKASTPYFMEGYNGYDIDRHSGMTGYIMQDRYPVLNAAYKHLDWYAAINKDK